MVTPNFQYYEYLYAYTAPQATQNEDGEWTGGEASWALATVCREETNGKGTLIQTVDGQSIVFSSLIQIPKGTAKIDEGVRVIVTKEKITDTTNLDNAAYIRAQKTAGLIVADGIVLKCDCGRLHNRIWI